MDLRNHCNLMSCTWYIFTFFPLMFLFEPQVFVWYTTTLEALQTKACSVGRRADTDMREYRSHRSDETRSRHDPVHHTFSSTARQPRGLQPLRCRGASSRISQSRASRSTEHAAPDVRYLTACGCHGQDPEHMRDMARVQTTQSSSTVTRV